MPSIVEGIVLGLSVAAPIGLQTLSFLIMQPAREVMDGCL